MNEYEIMIKNLENRVTELEKQLFAGVVKTVEPVKWQPKGGDWCIYGTGEICEDGTSEESQDFGTERQTEEQAQRAAVEMRRFNRLLALRDELCGDEDMDWTDDEGKYRVYFSHERGDWYVTSDIFCESITPYFTTQELALKARDMLNSGEVEL